MKIVLNKKNSNLKFTLRERSVKDEAIVVGAFSRHFHQKVRGVTQVIRLRHR